MLVLVKNMILVLIGFSAGVVISGAIFALIAVIGLIPRIAKKTNTVKYIKLYEEAIILGGIAGAAIVFIKPYMPIGALAVIFLSFCIGIFYGCFAASLAEVLDAIPIISRRLKIKKGMAYFMLAIAFGKLAGSILYFFVPGYYHI